MSTICSCGRNTMIESHTGLCMLIHYASYTGDGKHGVDVKELKSIVKAIKQDIKKNVYKEI